MQKLLAISAAIGCAAAINLQLIPPQDVIDQFDAEQAAKAEEEQAQEAAATDDSPMIPGSILPPKYVIMYFEADQLEMAGDFSGAEALREQAAAEKVAYLDDYQ